MTIVEFVDRLLLKRAATFMKAQDQYKLLTGETGYNFNLHYIPTNI